MVVRSCAAVVSVGKQHELRVAVPINEPLDTSGVGISSGKDVLGQRGDLGCVAFAQTAECLRAWVVTGASRKSPVLRPVAVQVCADASFVAARLAVLPPKTLRGLGVDEAIWVDEWNQVELVGVKDRDNILISCEVAGDDLIQLVLGSLPLRISIWFSP